jgi:hypothetical protein
VFELSLFFSNVFLYHKKINIKRRILENYEKGGNGNETLQIHRSLIMKILVPNQDIPLLSEENLEFNEKGVW